MLDTNLLERRTNFRRFQQDKYPSREKIEEIVQEAINVAPCHSDVFGFRIEIWGPEHAEEKKILMYTGVTPAKHNAKHYLREKRGTYEEWMEDMVEYHKTDPDMFNTQVQAPYLVVLIENWQDESDWWNKKHQKYRDWRHIKAAGTFMYALALVANRHELDASFVTRQMLNSEDANVGHPSNIVKGFSMNGYPKILTLMGLGYYDFSPVPGEKTYTNPDEDGWITHRNGGRYNIHTRKRDGEYKKFKPSAKDMISWK